MSVIPTRLKGGAAEAVENGCGAHVYLRQAEAARHLRLCGRTLERMRVDGTGPRWCRFGKRVAYRLADLEAWAASRTFCSTAEADAARERRTVP